MKREFVDILRCPETGQTLYLEGHTAYDADDIVSGRLKCADGSRSYPIRAGVARFVPESNYADNFGMQWNKFSKTQLDSYSGQPISAERFWKATGWKPEELADKWVLDAGCGAGRFAEVALQAGACVVALDYSSAADACYENLKQYPNLYVVQGDIYAFPFPRNFFDFVYSLGVLQHTPDVAKAFAALPPVLAAGGKLCVDFYEKSLKSRLLPKFWLRPLTKNIPKERLFTLLERYVPKLFSLSCLINQVPFFGEGLRRLVPVANYTGVYPLSNTQHLEWSLLDTFDWFAPKYDNPQAPETVYKWFIEADLIQVEVLKAGHLVGRGRKP